MIEKTPHAPTPGWKEVMKLAEREAGRLGHNYIGPEHYLLGIIRKGDGIAVQAMQNMNIDLEDVKLEIERLFRGERIPAIGMFPPNSEAKRIIELAKQIAVKMRHTWIGTEHLLLSIVRDGNNIAAKCLKNFGVDYKRSHSEIMNMLTESSIGRKSKSGQNKSKTPALDTFSRDLTQLASEGKLDPVIGREDEIERILQVLCRRTKNNPILLGEPGVGKTAIVEGLAQKIISGDIPDILSKRRLLSLDLAAIVAGTKYRGQFEERLKAVMQEIRRSRDVIIFIDEIHTLIGAGAAEGAIDASNMLKPALSRGELQCIGATTLEEFRKHIEKDGALERRFQSIMIKPPTIYETELIIKGLRSRYEAHHQVIFSDEAIREAVFLADRYITDRFLPDKAIDVIDEAGARARLQANIKPQYLKDMEKEIAQLDEKLREYTLEQEFEKCQEIKIRRDILIENKEQLYREWHQKQIKKNFKKIINPEDVAYIVSKWTGIPIMKLEEEESEKLLRMEEALATRVISQEEAIKTIAKAIRRARSGIKDPRRPTGSFIFLGPTGVGKTELAKTLAEFLFGDEEALIRIDMSEYMEKFSVSRLMGAPPGYVGYEEGGQLTEKVRQRPYSVVLLDEIEKAHPDIFSLLLQVFDDGRLTDSLGHVVDFRNTVVILTSNVGTRHIHRKESLGFHTENEKISYKKMKATVMTEVKKIFNPEFLNRIDELIVFDSLYENDIKKIVEIMIGHLNERLGERCIRLEISGEVKDFIVKKGYDPEYGARPLRRSIQRYIEDPLSLKLIDKSIPESSTIDCFIEEDEIIFRIRQEEPILTAESTKE
jgi:ATP-dependent Clp protease ATP-binding subunit ClpC